MTVSAQETIFSHVGNGVTTTFAFECKILSSDDLYVFVNDERVTSGFVVNGIGAESGGSVTFPVAPAAGTVIRLERIVELKRSTNYGQNGDFKSSTVNLDFDRIWMALQRFENFVGTQYAAAGRLLKLGGDDTDGAGAYRANNNRIQDLGSPLAAADATPRDWVLAQLAAFATDGSGQFVIPLVGRVVDTITALKNLPKAGSPRAFVGGYYTIGDGGGGEYRIDLADTTSADNGGSIIVAADGGRWKLVFKGEYWVEQFGAKAGTDSTAAFQIAAATGKPLRVGFGDFTISAPVSFSQSIHCSGEDDGQTAFTLTATGQFVLNDWNAKLDGFLMKSAVNGKTFIKCPGMSYFHCTNFRIEKIGSATGQIGIDFDCTTASIYFCNVDHGRFKVDYPIRISGVTANVQVFNANNIGSNTGTLYFQNFLSAITVDGTVACDTNNFAGYFEVGTNIITVASGALRQNRFHLVNDAVTRVFNATVAVNDTNLWEILGGGFIAAGTYPQNQVFVGLGMKTAVRATSSNGPAMISGSPTVIVWNNKTVDELTEFSSGAFTPKNTGLYRVSAAALSASAAWGAGTRWELRIYKNGGEYAKGDWNVADAAVTTQRSSRISTLVLLNAGDTLDIRVVHNQGANVALDSSASANAANYVDIERVS